MVVERAAGPIAAKEPRQLHAGRSRLQPPVQPEGYWPLLVLCVETSSGASTGVP